MAVPLVRELQPLAVDALVRVQVEQPPLQPRHPAVLRHLDPRQPVDGAHPVRHRRQLRRGDQVRLVDDDRVRVADLQVRGGQRRALPTGTCLPLLFLHRARLLRRGLVQTAQHVLGVDEGDDAVEVDGAAEALVDPEEGRDVARVSEAGGLEEDVVERAAAVHEGLDGVDAGVLDAAADAAVGELEPFFDLLAGLIDGEGLFDVRGWWVG